MGNLLFWIVIIFWIVKRVKKDPKWKERAGEWAQKFALDNDKKQVEGYRRARAENLQRTTNSTAKSSTESDILNRAKRNVKQAVNHSAHKEEKIPVCDHVSKVFDEDKKTVRMVDKEEICAMEPEEGVFLKEVEDILACGYQVTLPKQRDFIAEAEDMLAQYTLLP